MIVIGVDPGLTGAFAVLDHHGEALSVHDLPTMPIPEAGPKATIQREIDVRELYTLLRSVVPADESVICVVEHISSLGDTVKGDQAKASLAATKAYIMAVLRLQGLDTRRVAPARWKKMYGIREPEKGAGLPDAKKQALAKARQMFGDRYLPLAKHHNRAEALLIAQWGLRTLV
jgi:crossover junction endodeoxyribonuclease RuvC